MAEDKKPKSKGLAIASMVCGICGLVFCWTSWFAFILDVCAIVFGIVALVKIKKGEADGKGMAIAGIVCGGCSVVAATIIMIIVLSAVGAVVNGVNNALTDYKSNLDTSDYDWSWLDED